MGQIAIVCTSKSVDPAQLVLWARAWDQQAAEFCRVWGIEYRPVLTYATPDDLPTETGEVWLLVIEDDISAPGAEGFHDDQLGIIFARCLPDNNCESVSHEILEMLADPTCDAYRDFPDGTSRQLALEVCDPVEADYYPLSTQINDQPAQDVPVTNWVYPSYFDPNGKAPFDKLGKLDKPFSMIPGGGGYMIVRAANGSTNDVFAQPHVVVGSAAAHAKIGRKLLSPHSRLARRLYGKAA